ncbi:sulfite exporter TauE/SafE family protein [bacterium]|jgi:uncharacterized protein|nr:sulfite exporter TauE/SafE family protein [bacterium]
MILLILGLAALASATISGLVGMAGGILLLATMTFFLPFQVIVPIHGIVQLTSNITRAAILRKNIHRRILGYFLLGVPIGGIMGYQLLSRITKPEWLLILIIGLLIYVALKPKKLPYIHIPLPAFALLGGIAACLGCLIGATGPFLAPFFIREDLSKEQIVATKAASQLLVHIIKIPIFLALAFPYLDHTILIGVMMTGVFIGTKIGTTLLKKIDGKRFLMLIKLAMLATAAKLTFGLI